MAAVQYTSQLSVTSIAPLASGYAGGVSITLTGQGFGTLAGQSIVSICNTNCTVQASSASYNQLVCVTDALSTLDRIQKYGPPMLSIAQGTLFGATDAQAVFDGDVETYYSGDQGGVIGLDVGPASLLALTRNPLVLPSGPGRVERRWSVPDVQ